MGTFGEMATATDGRSPVETSRAGKCGRVACRAAVLSGARTLFAAPGEASESLDFSMSVWPSIAIRRMPLASREKCPAR